MKTSYFKPLVVAMGLGFSVSGYAESRVGVTFYHHGDDFIQLMQKEMSNKATSHHLQLLFNDSQNSQFVQNNQVEGLLKQRINVLAVNLVYPHAWDTILGKAKERNIPVIFFNRDPGEKAIASYNKAYYVGALPEEAGRLQAQMIAKQWKENPQYDLNHDGKIQYALLKGEDFHPDAEIRTKAVMDEFKKLGITAEQLALEPAYWRKHIAKEKVAAWLKTDRNRIEVIIANNDAMAIGAVEATLEQGKTLPIYGVDATPEALTLIQQGKLAGTVRNDWMAQSQAIMAFAENLANGKPADAGTAWKLKNRVLRIPYISVEKKDLN